jgi:hypothetical protein
MVVRLVLFLAIAIIVYFFVLRCYEKWLYRQYGYKLTGIPVILTMFAYAAVSGSSLFGIDNPMFGAGQGVADQIRFALMVGAPGIGLTTIWCLIKTKNILMALLHIPLLYFYTFIFGYSIVFVIVLLFLGLATKNLLPYALAPTKTGDNLCGICGRTYSGYRCPYCS